MPVKHNPVFRKALRLNQVLQTLHAYEVRGTRTFPLTLMVPSTPDGDDE